MNSDLTLPLIALVISLLSLALSLGAFSDAFGGHNAASPRMWFASEWHAWTHWHHYGDMTMHLTDRYVFCRCGWSSAKPYRDKECT